MLEVNILKGLKNGELYVYDGDLIGWINCQIISEDDPINKGNIVSRVRVKTADGSIFNRFYKVVNSEKEIKKDGCVYKLIL